MSTSVSCDVAMIVPSSLALLPSGFGGSLIFMTAPVSSKCGATSGGATEELLVDPSTVVAAETIVPNGTVWGRVRSPSRWKLSKLPHLDSNSRNRRRRDRSLAARHHGSTVELTFSSRCAWSCPLYTCIGQARENIPEYPDIRLRARSVRPFEVLQKNRAGIAV